MNIALGIHPEVLLYLSEIAHHNAICAEFPIAWHLRERLQSRAELRWVQAVARRESLSLNGDEIAQALEMKRRSAVSENSTAPRARLEVGRRRNTSAARPSKSFTI